MKKSFLPPIILFLTLIFYACSKEDSPNPVTTDPNDDVSINTNRLDFGNTEFSKTFSITIPTDKNVKWSLKRNRLWINLDTQEGNGTKTVSVSINRFLMNETYEIDTITISAARPAALNKLESENDFNMILGETKKIIVTASKSYVQILSEKIGNGVQFPSEIDTSISLVSTVKIKQGSLLNVTSGLGAFCQGTSFFTDAGTLSLKAKSSASLDKRDSIPFKKASFKYTDPVSSIEKTAYYYIPDDPKAPLPLPWTIDFDGKTYHAFSLWGTGGFASFRDSIISVMDPVLNSPAEGSSISKNSDLTITWTPTGDSEDKMFAVLVAPGDSSYKITASAVNDNNGSLIIANTKMKSLTGTTATLYLIRFKYKIDQISGVKIGILTLSQRGYSFTLN